MKAIIILSVILFTTFRGYSQEKGSVMVYLECVSATETFEKIGDTLYKTGAMYANEKIENLKLVLHDTLGSYTAIIKYRNNDVPQLECFKGEKKAFEYLTVPIYNEQGNPIGNKMYAYWRPIKQKICM